MTNTFSKADLQRAGETLYGTHWQTDMANALGLRDARRVRHWMDGTRTIPPGVWDDIAKLLQERGHAALALHRRITAALPA